MNDEARPMQPLLSIRNLRVEYRGLVALDDFSLDVMPGESYGLVGESGCGKSTLLMAILGYLGRNGAIARGEILFEGRNLVALDEQEMRSVRGGRIAIVYQEPAAALNPTLTIGRQLMETPIQHQGAGRAEALARAEQVLADVKIPDPATVLKRYPHQLSGGQKQRVVIAMALLANPSLLLLDEPTTSLDVTVEATVLDLVNDLREKYGTAFLYISHNLGVIAKVCERIGVMYAGELVEEAPVRDLFAQPRHPYTQGLLACLPRLGATKNTAPLVPIPGLVPAPGERPPGCAFGPRCASFRGGLCDTGSVPLRAVGEKSGVRCLRVDDLEPPPSPEPAIAAKAQDVAASPALSVEKLTKVYEFGRARLLANDDLTFAAERGRVLAIVGESGSGKSTFARVLAGLHSATEGAIAFEGTDISRTPVRRRTAEQVAAIQMVFQNPDGTLNPSHSVGQPIARALRRFGLAKSRAEIDEKVSRLLDLVRLPPAIRHRTPRQLSGGQKQRIAIARAFAGDPSLVIADEPVSALDVSVQAAVINLLIRLQAERGATMIFISHDLALVQHLADEAVVMYLGRIMERGPAAALFEPPYHPYTEALLSAAPAPDPTLQRQRIRLEGETPSPLSAPRGCRFASRCPRKLGALCDEEPPPEQEAGDGHMIACHIPVADLRKVAPVFGERRAAPAEAS